MDLARLLPLAMALGGAGVAVRHGGPVVDRLIDTVKVVLVRSELSQAAKILEAEAVLGHKPPRTPEALSALLRESMRTGSNRDSSLDLWDTPYQLGRDRGVRVLRSLGPNRRRDSCTGDGADGKAAKTAAARAAQAPHGTQGADAGAAADEPIERDDDICVTLTLSGGDPGGGSDPMGGADDAYRPIRRE